MRGAGFRYPRLRWVGWCSGHEKVSGFLDELNDGALEQLVLERTRGWATLDLILWGTQDLVRGALPWNSGSGLLSPGVPC